MKELALHILDLVQNSIAADAALIKLNITENLIEDQLIIEIKDNGRGMDKAFLDKVKDPFVTTRTTRKVGLGISLMQAACERCKGGLIIDSEKGIGTQLKATFVHSHIDRAPLGNMADTMVSIILSGCDLDYIYRHRINENEFCFDTREIRQILGPQVPLNEPDILMWIKEYIREGLSNLRGGVSL